MKISSSAKPTGELGLMVIGKDGMPRPPYPNTPFPNIKIQGPRKRLFMEDFRKRTMNKGWPVKPQSIMSMFSEALPNLSDPSFVRQWKAINFMGMVRKRSFSPILLARMLKIPHFHGALRLKIHRNDGLVLDLGLVGLKSVTTAGVEYLADAFQGSTEPELFNFHGIGLGSTAENITDTDVETELTTQYTNDNLRDTGTQGEGASANIYQSLGLNQVDASVALREHGLMDNATVGSGTLWDRTVYALINLSSGESLQSTYEVTLSAGG